MTQYINGYALALFELACEEKKLEKYKHDAASIIAALHENKEFESILNGKDIDFNHKVIMVEKAFKGAQSNIVNFILIVTRRLKAHIIIHVLTKLLHFLNNKLDIHEGVVYTPEKLAPQQITGVQKKVSKILNLKTIELENRVDKEMVYGFKVIVNDEIIEDSAQSRLENVRSVLLREK